MHAPAGSLAGAVMRAAPSAPAAAIMKTAAVRLRQSPKVTVSAAGIAIKTMANVIAREMTAYAKTRAIGVAILIRAGNGVVIVIVEAIVSIVAVPMTGRTAAAVVAAVISDGGGMRILLVEDDADLQRLLKKALGDAGYAVDSASDGEEGHFLGDTEPYDLAILDLGLPKLDGVHVLEKWRSDGRTMPVLILTARDRWSDKVAGFDAGADDYLAKPFYTEELLARVRALLRRAAGLATSEIEIGPLRIDTRFAVSVNGNPVKLTSLEYRLLAYLAHHQGKVVSRTELAEHL